MGDIHQSDIRDHRRNEGRLHHHQVVDITVLGNNKSRRTHYGGHQLAVGAAGHLHCRGFMGGVAHLLHHWDSEGSGGHHVGDTGSGDHSSQAAGQNRRLGGAALESAQEAKGHLHKIASRPRLVQHCPEQDKQKHDRGRHIQGDPVDTLGADGNLVDKARQGDPLKGDHPGHVGPEKAVQNKYDRHNRQHRPQGTAGGFEHRRHQDNSDNHIPGNQCPRTHADTGVIDHNVQGRQSRHQGQHKIQRGNTVPGGQVPSEPSLFRFFEHGIAQVHQGNREGQVDRADEYGVQNQNTGEGKLKERPGGRNNRNQKRGLPLDMFYPQFGLFGNFNCLSGALVD